MNDRITVPLPLNLSGDELHLYTPYDSYEAPRQKVKYFKEVFISNSGLCVNRIGLIKECHHNYPQQYQSYLSEASTYYHRVIDIPQELITLDNESVYLAVHHPWFNYYHWICESIFRLWLVRKKLGSLTLILPEFYRRADFIMGSLQPFELKNIFYIPDGKSVLVRNLCLPQIKPVCDSYNLRHIKQVRSFYVRYVTNKKINATATIDRLYVSRKLAGRRNIVNEDEVLPILFRNGFAIFYPEEHSFLEQVAIFKDVQYLVGEHGSGLTNMLFMDRGTSVLELHKNKTNELDHPSCLFWYLADALGMKYYHQSCETYGKEDYFDGDYIIEPAMLERNLKLLLS